LHLQLLAVQCDGQDREQQTGAQSVINVPQNGHQKSAHPNDSLDFGFSQDLWKVLHLQEHPFQGDHQNSRQNTLKKGTRLKI
jgi:hypothetical protein